ncbi:MAG: DNRLRE domain-containing protein [Spirochaetes bacterium]|nr:DNRLRE domain-containing protein [Spirochaetota bacterium]
MKKFLFILKSTVLVAALIMLVSCSVSNLQNNDAEKTNIEQQVLAEKALVAADQPAVFKTVTLTPKEDSRIFSIYPDSTGNHATYFAADQWTWSGTEGTIRSLVKFDLSSIPDFDESQNNYIDTATLYLYHHPDVGHSGENRSEIQRVRGSWSANTITWNNNPLQPVGDRIFLSKSTSSTQNYAVNLTHMMYIYHRYGTDYNREVSLQLRLNIEEAYARMYFASSNHPVSAYHPKLIITYRVPITLSISGPGFILLKNPSIPRTVTYRANLSSGAVKSYTWKWNGSVVSNNSTYTRTFYYNNSGYSENHTLTLEVTLTDNSVISATKNIQVEHLGLIEPPLE